LRTYGLLLRLGQGWQEHPGQNGDDGDNDQKFDERKPATTRERSA
jgi:hypothetical protein